MDERATGGDRRSSWLTFQRRLFLVRQLVRGPCDGPELIAAARSAIDEEIFPRDAATALRRDLASLRNDFGCTIRLDPEQGYVLESLGNLALLDLPDDELEALSFVARNMVESSLPNTDQLAALARRVAALMPPERRARLGRMAAYPRIDEPDPISEPAARTIQQIKRALRSRQLEFEYVSSFSADGSPVRHIVWPYELIQRDGHTYLEAFCAACTISELVQTHVTYRVDRIVPESVRPLPRGIPAEAPPRPRTTLRYRLSRRVAGRRDIARWFDDSAVLFHPDGSAEVTAQISDLWQARQVLLRYREHCRVLEPPELVEMMRASIAAMAAVYHQEEP